MHRIHVGIVEDHLLVRSGLVRILDPIDDVEVVGAVGSCRDAAQLVAQHEPDVLLLDLSLPDGDGLDAIELLTTCCPTMSILVVSMHSEPEFAQEAIRRGASGFVAKSDSAAMLVEAIRRAAAGETLAVDPGLSPREREILRLIAEGWTNERIASCLGVQPKTVSGHCQRMMDKLEIHTRAGLVAHGRRTRDL